MNRSCQVPLHTPWLLPALAEPSVHGTLVPLAGDKGILYIISGILKYSPIWEQNTVDVKMCSDFWRVI